MSRTFIAVLCVFVLAISFLLWREAKLYSAAGWRDSDGEKKIKRAIAGIKEFIYFCERNAQSGRYTSAQKAAIRRLKERFDEDEIRESLAEGTSTSYTVQKKKIYLCVRQKDPGGARFVDHNTVMFTLLHEISHVANDGIGHDEKFWSTFKFFLREAVRGRLYFPVDYFVSPVEFCGLTIRHNPLYDAGMIELK